MTCPSPTKGARARPIASRSYQLVETFIEAGASATNDPWAEVSADDRIDAGTSKPTPFDVFVVHSFSRFFHDHFELAFYVRKLAKNGVKLVSITQEMGDDPMHVMMRQIMALFDEYPSEENAKHVLRAMNENARQGVWNGACRRSAIASSPPNSGDRRPRRSWRSTRCTPKRRHARAARQRLHCENGGYRRDHLRALAQRVEVADREARIMGSKSELLRTLVAASAAKRGSFEVGNSVVDWRTRHDSNV